MTLADMTQLVVDVETERARFEALSAAEKRDVGALALLFERWGPMEAALRALVKAAPPPDHPAFSEPTFEAVRDVLVAVRQEIDKVAGRGRRNFN